MSQQAVATFLAGHGVTFPAPIVERAAAFMADSVPLIDALEQAILDDYFENGWPEPLSAGGEWITFETDSDTPGAAPVETEGNSDANHDEGGLSAEREPVAEAGGKRVSADDNMARAHRHRRQPRKAGRTRRTHRKAKQEFSAVEPMSGEEFAGMLEALQLTQKEAAAFLQKHPVTISNWTRSGPDPFRAMVLRYLVREKINAAEFAKTGANL